MAISKYTDLNGVEQTSVKGPRGTVLVTMSKGDTRYTVWFSDSLKTLLRTSSYTQALKTAKRNAGIASDEESDGTDL